MKKNKQFRLKCFYTFNYIMGIVFILSASMLDSKSWLPTITLFISLVWLWFALVLTEMAKVKK